MKPYVKKIPKSKSMTQTNTNGNLKTQPSRTPIEVDTNRTDTMVFFYTAMSLTSFLTLFFPSDSIPYLRFDMC